MGHNFEDVAGTAKPATCTEPGNSTDQKCSRCGEFKAGVEVSATGHVNTEIRNKKAAAWTVVREATALKAGKMQQICKVCGDVQYKTIAKLAPAIKLSKTKKSIRAKKSFSLTVSNLQRATASNL